MSESVLLDLLKICRRQDTDLTKSMSREGLQESYAGVVV